MEISAEFVGTVIAFTFAVIASWAGWAPNIDKRVAKRKKRVSSGSVTFSASDLARSHEVMVQAVGVNTYFVARLEAVEQTLERYESIIGELKSQVTDLTKENGRLKVIEDELPLLKDEIMALREENVELRKENTELRKVNVELREIIEDRLKITTGVDDESTT